MDEYQKQDLRALRSAPKYRAYLGDLCAPYVRGRNVMEVGAGLGDFGRQLIQYDPSFLTLLEPGDECFQELSQYKNPKVKPLHQFSFDLAKECSGTWDTLIYSNVLEHIKDDIQELKIAAQLLKPGGTLVIIVPAHPFLYSEIDKRLLHHRRYSRKTFLNSASQVPKLQVETCVYINKLGVLGWLLNKVKKSSHQSQTLFRIFDTYLLPLSKALDTLAPKSFGLSLFAVLKKE